jgi:Lrp/AsnC family transcriptional regulator for asnA, asnC and gidA
MRELEEMDKIILKELLKNGRKSFADIARDNNLSKDVVWKHYKDMEKAGVIVGATVQYDYQRFGFAGVVYILVNCESQNFNTVFEYLSAISNILPFELYNSPYNIGVITAIKSLKRFDELKEMLKGKTPINSFKAYLWTDVRNLPENLVFPSDIHEKKLENDGGTHKKGNVKLDNKDIQLVEALVKDGRLPFSRIGKTLGISTDTVTRRYLRLVENGFIKVSIQINPKKIGYKAILNFFLAFLSQNEMQKGIDSLSKIPNITYLVKISGDFDLQVVSLVKDVDEIIALNKEIMKIPYIGRIEAVIREIPPVWPGQRQHISTF